MPSSGTFPSGEAMKTAEQPLLSKVKDRQIAWGNVWEDVMTLALRMQGHEVSGLTCNWLDTTPRNEEALLESLLLKEQIGVSKKQLLREAGYSDEQIERFAKEREEDTQGLAEQMLTAFDRGAAVEGTPPATERAGAK